jgi:hypothetical protein
MKSWVETIKVWRVRLYPSLHTFIFFTQFFILLLSLPNSSYFYCPYRTLHTFIVPTQLFILLLSLPNSSYFYCLFPTLHTFIVSTQRRDYKSVKSSVGTINVWRVGEGQYEYEELDRDNKSMKRWVFIVSTQLFILLLSLPNSSYFYCLYPTLHTFRVR